METVRIFDWRPTVLSMGIVYKGDKPRQLLFVHRQRRLAGSLLLEGPREGAITVQLEPWGTISGRIIDAGGKPRAKSLIRGWAPGHGNRAGYGELPERHLDRWRLQSKDWLPI